MQNCKIVSLSLSQNNDSLRDKRALGSKIHILQNWKDFTAFFEKSLNFTFNERKGKMKTTIVRNRKRKQSEAERRPITKKKKTSKRNECDTSDECKAKNDSK